ncbi:hypothetical protein [Absidia glauca]|uniref:Uncharacterized protein n=1 Tax=Absidia glauca TaxID=4829 RepID=A0A168NCE0_ABSGL|nr:hypothetical protein [Absidia glauca]
MTDISSSSNTGNTGFTSSASFAIGIYSDKVVWHKSIITIINNFAQQHNNTIDRCQSRQRKMFPAQQVFAPSCAEHSDQMFE